MSGFQIPGLGQAKPNEVLPPLPADVLAAAASAQGFEDVASNETSEAKPNVAVSDEKTTESTTTNSALEPDAMVIDQAENPPSLTHALEAALGGLDATPTAQAQPQAQANPPPAELQNDTGDNPEWEVDSSPYESSSESSSSDDSSDEDSDNEGYELLGVEETARLLMQAEGGSDDEGEKNGKGSSSAQVRTKNELTEEVIPKPDVTITPEMKIEELGSIEHIVENIALVMGITPGEYQVLDTGSVLCTAERVVIGAVAETIGKVLQPMYTVRFSSEEEVKGLGIEVGTKIFYPVDHATYVFTEPLKNLKGSDASNLHDEEVGDDEMEFSDDEKEAEYKRALKQKKKDKWKNNAGGRGGKDPHPLRQEMRPDGGLNYDDDEDGPYKPLARPPGYGDGPTSSEPVEPPPGRSFSRGGRRGDFRGRGGRGRGSGRGGRGGYNQPRDGYSLPPQGQQQAPAPTPHSPWGANPTPPQTAAPAMPNFGFQLPGWPQPPAQASGASAVPPPPPGWPAQGQQGQPPNGGAFVNPAFFAALMSQMQAQNGQPQWPQPPNGGQGQR